MTQNHSPSIKLSSATSQKRSALNKRNFVLLNWQLIVATVILMSIGLINLYSASSISNDEGVFYAPYFSRQLIWGGFGIVVMATVLLFDYHKLEYVALPFFILILILLILVPIIGVSAGGARRWIDLGILRFQPSEFAKFSIIIYCSYLLAKKGESLSWLALFHVISVASIPFLLVAMQPDLGTALMVFLILAGMVLYHGIKWRVLRVLLVTIPLSLPFTWLFLLDYQKQRVLTMLDPSRDPYGAGYQTIQSQIAIGSGEVFGKGFQEGTQSQLSFLPEKHTDFAIAVLGEEWGFAGTLVTVSLFCIFLYFIFSTVRDAKDRFGSLLCTGIFFYFFWQILINIGMVIGIMPVVGIPLPFISYGGTSMLVNCVLIGVVLNVSVQGSLFKD